MSDQQHRIYTIRPPGCVKQVNGCGACAYRRFDSVIQLEGIGCLNGSLRRTDQNAGFLGKLLAQPCRHFSGLFFAVRGKPAFMVTDSGMSILSLGVTPKYQFHA